MTYFWIAVLAFSITALVLMVIHDRGVRAVLNTMAIVARAEGLDPEKMRVWLEQERLKTPWRARVSWSLWTGIVSFVVSNDVVARYARSSPEIQILLSRFRAAHPGETAQSGAWPVPNEEELKEEAARPKLVGSYNPDHEVARQKFVVRADGLIEGELQGVVILYVTKDGRYSYDTRTWKYLFLWNGAVVGRSDDTVTIHDVLGTRFSYAELMGGSR